MIGLTDFVDALELALTSHIWDVAGYILNLQPQSATPSMVLKMSPRYVVITVYYAIETFML